MTPSMLVVAGDHNLASAWAALGRHGGFAVGQTDTVSLTSSGLPIAFFNGAFTTGRCADPQRVVADVIEFFGERNVPFLLWVRHGVDDALLDAGLGAGLRNAGGPPAMVMPAIGHVPGPPAELELSIASTFDDVEAHRAVVAGGFGMPAPVAAQLLGGGLLTDPQLAVVIGRVDGQPVATALLAQTDETAGIYNVATLAEYRGRGFGEAATWAAVGEGARRGCTHSVLQSSDLGYPVYSRMGFVDVGRYVQLEGPPST